MHRSNISDSARNRDGLFVGFPLLLNKFVLQSVLLLHIVQVPYLTSDLR